MTFKKTSPGIYRIDIGKYSYYGSAASLSQRKSRHLRDLRADKHHSPYVQDVFNKYGEDEFTFTVLLVCEKEDLLFYEQKFLDKFFDEKFNMNTCRRANSQLGLLRSDETKAKMSASAKGKPCPWNAEKNKDPDFRAKVSAGKKGVKLSKAHVAALTGKKRSPEARKRMSEAKKAYYAKKRAERDAT